MPKEERAKFILEKLNLKPLEKRVEDTPRKKVPGRVYVDGKALYKYLRIKENLEKYHFPNVKITFSCSYSPAYT